MPLVTIGPNITSQPVNDNFAYVEGEAQAAQAAANTAQATADGVKSSLDSKDSVRAATTANIVLNGVQTIDGVVLVAGNRVLVKNQATASQNGIYVVSAGAWTRATDADANAEVTSGMEVRVTEGTLNAGTKWFLSTPDPIVVGTTNLALTLGGVPNPWAESNHASRTYVYAYPAANQAIAAITSTKVLFGTEIADNLSEFASSRYTASKAGRIIVISALRSVSSTFQDMEVRIFINGADSGMIAAVRNSYTAIGVRELFLNANDYLEIYLYAGTAMSVLASSNETFITIGQAP